MIMCLDVGNSQIYGGVFDGDHLSLQFRRTSRNGASSDELALFFRSVLRENDFDPSAIRQVAICSVVPEALHSLKNSFLKYFGLTPFILQAGVKTGLKVKYRNPLEVGSDRIANAVAATHMFPNENLVVIDFGTATTFCAINSRKEYLGGTIIPGLRVAMQSLETNTSKLPSVEIIPCSEALGRSTVESIQSGLFFGTLGATKEIVDRMRGEVFAGQQPKVIGTGGFASLFAEQGIFHEEITDLVLRGLFLTLKMNT